ncbi:MAG: type II toxin-antitoxin system mRNA interferase toxin, RelE/StbE family [Candidatus Komeilibacteria bacterium]
MSIEIIYSQKFAREYRKLPREVKAIAIKQELIFRQDPFDPRLKTHKLKGKLKDFLSFSISFRYRIIFEFDLNRNTVYFHAVGDHDIYE